MPGHGLQSAAGGPLRPAARTALALASVLALVLTGYGWVLSRQLGNAPTTTGGVLDHPVAPPDWSAAAPGPMNVLLVGTDSRTDAQGNPLPQWLLDELHAGGNDSELNTDTLILVHVPADASRPAVVVSIPRDSYVDIPGYGEHKINSAYGRAMRDAQQVLRAQDVSGPELDQLARQDGRRVLVQTVEQLTGVTVDHYAEITLAGFAELTQAVGGVQVCLSEPVYDSYSGADFPAGVQTLEGGAALAFVRQRHGLPRGDLDRIVRQQAFLAGLADKILTARVLTSPNTLSALRDAISRYVVLDEGWDLTGLLVQARSLTDAPIEFRTIPTGRADLATPEDGEAVQVDPLQVQDMVSQLFSDSPPVPGYPAAGPPPPVPSAGATEPAEPAEPAPVRPVAQAVPCVN